LTIFSVVLSICLGIENRSNEPKLAEWKILARRLMRLWWLVPIILLWVYRGNLVSELQLLKPYRVTGTFDGTSAEIQYTGPWTRGPYPDAVDGTLSYSNDPGASARLSFKGTEITWVYALAGNRGIGSVKIDGIPRGDIDLYSPTIIWQSRTTFAGLAQGKHTFEVTVSGLKDDPATDRYIDVDALVVR
jgi:hypothetical protein